MIVLSDSKTISTVHPTAIIAPEAKIAPGVSIGPYCVIGPDVEIKENTFIGPHVIIEVVIFSRSACNLLFLNNSSSKSKYLVLFSM